MSYNEIAETFSEYSKGKSSNCQHLIELFQQAMIQMEEEVECPRCNEKMLDVQACHLLCPRCGSHMDCSDKGSVW